MRPRGIALIELKEGTEKRIDNTILASGKDKQDVDDDSMVVREATAKDIALNVIEQISFQKHVGCIGKMLLLSMLFVSLLLATIFCMYANVFGRFDFQRIYTPFVWIFLLSSILYIVRIVRILLTRGSSESRQDSPG